MIRNLVELGRFWSIPVFILSTLTGSATAEEIDFTRDVQPLLSENCYFCHGPDAETRAADLRLDTKDGARGVLERDADGVSELVRRITSTDPDVVMPPRDSNRSLKPEQIQLLSKWVESGGNWGDHWSWTAISAPLIPAVEATSAAPVHNPIDAFIQHRLLDSPLTPAPVADKRTLIRRVTLDLTGLAPDPEEVQAFLDDEDPDAYERLVDRLLASPHYGERMAWNWLEAARYADSNGYQGDRERTMWPWRDWVVDAFNRNLPYDDFTVWQLAGDLLPNATDEQKLATGFCRNHPINGEGGRIAEENRVDYVMDMAETTGTVWLGLTLNCCRCHDHKYDQLTNQDYYQFFAFFNQTPVNGGGGDPQTKPVLETPTADETRRLAELEEQLADAKQHVQTYAKTLQQQQTAWETQQLAGSSSDWQVIDVIAATAEHQQLEQRGDRSLFASGPNPRNDTYTISARTKLAKLTGLWLEALRDPSHTDGGLARSNSGNFVLTELELTLIQGETETPLKIASAEATFEQGGLKVTNTFDGNPQSGWAVYSGKPIDRDHGAVFRLEAAVDIPTDAELRVVLRHDSQHESHNLGRFRLSLTDVAQPQLGAETEAFLLALQTPVDQRTAEQKKLLKDRMQSQDTEYQRLAKVQKEVEDRLQGVRKGIAKVMVMEDMPEPRKTYMLNRGLYTAPTAEVTAAVPASLPPLPEGMPANRLGLAKWLVSDENPLTARVTVNHFWQQIFGIGLVKTPEDFGVQGEVPVHLDLLNWLAADFRNSGWDVKRFMKQVVLSHTYRQSSRVTATDWEHDPNNRLLARGARYRWPSWMLRDQALKVSGLLTSRQGGPSVNVYQPKGIWEEATFGNKKYVQDHGDALYRRSLYVFWRRIVGPPLFFDSASRLTCTVKPFLTNTPLHALQTLNDVTYVEAARVLAEKCLTAAESDEERLSELFRSVLCRSPSPAESEILLAGLQRTQAEFQADPAAALELVQTGESPRDESLPEIAHAAWTSVCLAVLNLDETLSRQ